MSVTCQSVHQNLGFPRDRNVLDNSSTCILVPCFWKQSCTTYYTVVLGRRTVVSSEEKLLQQTDPQGTKKRTLNALHLSSLWSNRKLVISSLSSRPSCLYRGSKVLTLSSWFLLNCLTLSHCFSYSTPSIFIFHLICLIVHFLASDEFPRIDLYFPFVRSRLWNIRRYRGVSWAIDWRSLASLEK